MVLKSTYKNKMWVGIVGGSNMLKNGRRVIERVGKVHVCYQLIRHLIHYSWYHADTEYP